jgi:hypothetical protein
MLGSEFDNNFVFLPSVGASGGVLVAFCAVCSSKQRCMVADSYMDRKETTTRMPSYRNSATLEPFVQVLG